MKLSQAILVRTASVLCALLLIVPYGYGKTSHNSKSAPNKSVSNKQVKKSAKSAHVSRASSKSIHRSKRGKKIRKVRGQQKIDPDRTREIQSALIREHYLNGEPSGVWDAKTKAALTKFQSDNGWQTRILPDSRALIKLGLGPSREGLLNPESAAMANSHELGAEKAIPGGSEPQR